jgi:predicted pyridoxine 5'-phosphate oxidase superfamily flavin-nucleotide-binding protein
VNVTDWSLDDLERCFGGAIPAILTTASSDGVPNIMYLSRAHKVDDDRIALSNQFMSKTARNLAANPRADLLLCDPHTHDEYRLTLQYERTDRRGHVFDRLRADIDSLAALVGMQDVFRLRAADIFRVLAIDEVPHKIPAAEAGYRSVVRTSSDELTGLAELARRIARAPELDILVETALQSLEDLFGYRHTMVLLLDEQGRNLYTVAARGFSEENVGAEVPLGEGQIGIAAQRCEISRVDGISQLRKYSTSIRREYEGTGVQQAREIPMPGLAAAQSRIVVPAVAQGALVGVLVAESERVAAFDAVDEHILGVAAAFVANAVGDAPEPDRDADEPAPAPARLPDVAAPLGSVVVRYFASDASTFFDGDYLIKGVAGRILWSLLSQYVASGRAEFTNRELRLDPALELPGFKDNLESRLLLLKRRLDEREAAVRIEKTSRGRFRIQVDAQLRLELAEQT